jgi:hypothetical protein
VYGTLIIYLTDFSRAKVKSVNCGFCLMLFSVQFTFEYELRLDGIEGLRKWAEVWETDKSLKPNGHS